MKQHLLPLLLAFFAIKGMAQTEPDLLSSLEEEKTTQYVTNAFKSPYVVNAKSIEMLPKGVLDFRILHRFGAVSGGGYQLFGLDQASMRLGFDYGVTKNLMLGFGRSNNKKEVDASIKYRILQQSVGARVMPVSLVWVSGLTINGLKEPAVGVETKFSRRLAYYHELIVGRKFSDKFSLQITSMLLHQNITGGIVDPNNLYCLGLGTRWKITKRTAITLDYFYSFNKFDNRLEYTPLSIGVDIETGGHVFQLHFSNATGMNERAIIQDENGQWLKGEIRFGFNLSRWFQIVKQPIQ
ncbi:MAG: DUF5777 family beta-barrel protein [Saprospiraceae bacterium]